MPDDLITDYYKAIEDTCTGIYEKGEPTSPFEVMKLLMDLPGLPIHTPIHHFIMPASLLTCAAIETEIDEKHYQKMLTSTRQRSITIPGGSCGNCGNCGAAVGVGIFMSVFTGTTPKSHDHWADCNLATAKALLNVASIEGPRCCKRDSFLALLSAIDTANNILGLHMEKPQKLECTYYMKNEADCKKEACPFHPDTAKY